MGKGRGLVPRGGPATKIEIGPRRAPYGAACVHSHDEPAVRGESAREGWRRSVYP